MQFNFAARVESAPPALFVEVPNDVVAAFGSGTRPPVRVSVKGVEARTRVAVYGGRSLMRDSADAGRRTPV